MGEVDHRVSRLFRSCSAGSDPPSVTTELVRADRQPPSSVLEGGIYL